jgi:flagellar protein FlbD
MIKATRLDHMEFVLNSDLIEHMEATPDTVITLVGGKKFVVAEGVDEMIRRVVAYQRAIRERAVAEAS